MSALSDHLPGWFRRRSGVTANDAEQSEPATASATTGGGSEGEPVVVWEAANLMEAHVVKGRLESEGIPAIIRGEALATIYGLTAGNLAAAKVLVPAPLAERALDLLLGDEGLSDLAEEDSGDDSGAGESNHPES